MSRSGRMVVDSNILVYAINRASPKHSQAQEFLQRHKKQLCIAHQNILETVRVLTHPKFLNPMPPELAMNAVMAIAQHLTLITPTSKALFIAQELMKLYSLKADQVFDAYLAATALAADVAVIATDNEKDFVMIKGLQVVNPFKA